MDIKLRGITWNHSRGYVSVVATAQRFMELDPGEEIIWRKAFFTGVCGLSNSRIIRSIRSVDLSEFSPAR